MLPKRRMFCPAPPKPATKAKSRKLKDVTFTLKIAYDVKKQMYRQPAPGDY